MKKFNIFFFFSLICIHVTILFSDTLPPKREFRGVWIATVSNLDWPSRGAATDYQKQLLIDMLDKLKAAGMNAVVFQVRPECDALYESSYEPWSYWLTGKQGKAPQPFFDPLRFAIQEAHKRGMELHAWFNPYRAMVRSGAYPPDARHVTQQHPEWILTFGELKILDPGLPQVRDYVTDVIVDVVSRYDVDGVHFDDYFYPYPPDQITDEDDQTFADYSRGFDDQGDWRRDNVNLLVSKVYQAIQSLKPFVKFGISPFGIWKNGVPDGVVGLSAYHTIYTNALAWIEQQTIDYLTPQLYWPFGGGQDYGRLMPWWEEQLETRHLYVGHGAYRISSWPRSEMPDQIRFNRQTGTEGSIFFRANTILSNPRGFADSLKSNLYRYPALFPNMAWKDQVKPNAPVNLRYEPIVTGEYGLSWDSPYIAADGDTAVRYVVYRFEKEHIRTLDLDSSQHIYDLTGRTFLPVFGGDPEKDFYSYAVTALDRNANESAMSNVITLMAPAVPQLAVLFEVQNDTPRVILYWPEQMDGVNYQVQVSADSSFQNALVYEAAAVADTFDVLGNLKGQMTYYCRVQALSAGGRSDYSELLSFRTLFPASPDLITPKGRNTALRPTFVWNSVNSAQHYHLQVSTDLGFDPESLVFEQENIADTTLTLSRLLEERTTHYWRVRCKNEYGYGAWANRLIFKTDEASLVFSEEEMPESFVLEQNFPNPFNPETNISFSIPASGHVRLVVYNTLGQQVTILLDQELNRGEHRVRLDGTRMAAGVYIYCLQFGHDILRQKMTLVK
jgi:uncharacterized lipoprotein YddW (UPF0748 family)